MESKPMTTSEPTTGEIVRALRENGDVYFGETEITCDQIADRLESQERENASLRAENKGLHKEIIRRGIEIKTMTARAEQAERERDAARKDIDMTNAVETGCGLCLICKKQCDDASNGCFFCKDFEWRGLPQDGEGA